MYTQADVRNILDIAVLAGKTMLENGAETYRAEETIDRICASKGLSSAQNFVIPTGIFLSCTFEENDYSYVRRVKPTVIDLHIISLVNQFSRKYVSENMSYEEALEHLKEIRKVPHFPPLLQYFSGGCAGGFFTLIFGGNGLEAFFAFLTSFFVVLTVRKVNLKTKAFFLKNLFGGMINTILAISFVKIGNHFGFHVNMNMIVIGSIMPLVPGVAITNALRDSISGDFISGMSKLSEALGVAMAIAMGVGFILHGFFLLTGGVL